MARRGSTGDSSDNDFSGGFDNDTDAGSGVTGDDGGDTTFGGGGGDDSGSGTVGGGGDDGGGFDGGDSDNESSNRSGVVGGGGDRRGADSDDGFDNDTDTGRGVTGDDGRDTTFEGGRDDRNRTQAPEGDTGLDDPQDSPDRGTSVTERPDGRTVATGDGFDPRVGDTSDRGTGLTRGPQGSPVDVVLPAPDLDGDGVSDAAETAADSGFSPRRGETRAAVTRFGQRQLDAVRRREGGQTAFDRALEGLEAETGVDIFPGEGDVVQGVERELRTPGVGPVPGGLLPTPDQAEEFGADAAATTAVGGRGRTLRILDARLDREEAAREFGGTFARRTAEAANLPASILGAGRTAEAAGETGVNLAAGFGGRALAERNIGPLDAETQQQLADAGVAAGERGREQLGDATRTLVQGADVTAERVQNRPVEALGTGAFLGASALGGTAVSTAATRGLSALPDRVRSVRARRQADARVDFEDVTSEQGAAGDLPNFETEPSAPTSEAVSEVRQRAADNPDDVLDAVDEDAALFQSTEAELGPEFEARRGSSELPGLFTSPDASPLRLDVGDEQSSLLSTDVRLPRARDFTSRDDRLAAFPGDRVEGFPDDATGSGRLPDGDGGFEPDPETSGGRFLDEQAEEGTAFVRPQGGRTTELEAIFPPGSEFGQTGSLAVDLPSGRTVPIDVFRRADDLPDADGGGPVGRFLGDERGRATLGDDRPDATRTVREIDQELQRLRRRDRDRLDGEPTTPVASSGGASAGGVSSSGLPTLGDLSSAFGSGGTGTSPGGSPFGRPTSGFGSGMSSPRGPGGSSPSVFPSGTSSTPTGPSSPSAPSGASPSVPGSSAPSAPSTPSDPAAVMPALPGAPGGDDRRREDDERDDREGAIFGVMFGERSFASGIADAEEAAASFFGGDREFEERPPTDTAAERTDSVVVRSGDELF